MKKLANIFLVSLVAVIFAACGSYDDTPRELDFRSMRDVELDVIISLGDSRSRLEELLGTPIRYGIWFGDEMFSFPVTFENGMNVMFSLDRLVTKMSVDNAERFEIYGLTADMTQEQITELFTNLHYYGAKHGVQLWHSFDKQSEQKHFFIGVAP
jgi:hypothetical protein